MSDKKPRRLSRYLTPVIIFIAALLFIVLMEIPPWFSQLDRATFDFAFGIRAHLPPSPAVAVVSIDESSLKEIGPWPWTRDVHEALLNKLKEGGAKVAVFDVLFDVPREEDKDFARGIKNFGKVVLGRDLSTTVDPQFALQQTIEPSDELLNAGAVGGFVFTPTDPDTKVRRSPWQVKGESTLATEALYQYTGHRVRIEGDKVFIGD